MPSEATTWGRTVSFAAAFSVGLLSALQSRMNGGLAEAWSDPLAAAGYSFGTGFIVLTILAVTVGPVRRGVVAVVHALRASRLRWWEVVGGLCGATFVVSQSSVVPIVGVAAFTVGVVAGQSANSLVVDRLGLGPRGTIAISGARLLAAGLAVLAVVVALAGRWEAQPTPPVVPVAAAVGAGVLVAFQQALNGRVAVESGNAVSATWLNFLMGTVMIAVLLAVTHLGRTASSPTDGPAPWLLLGGVVGLVFIALAAWSVPRIGVLMTALLAVAGNLTSSLLLDVLLPTPGSVVNAALLVGVGLAFAAVALGARGRSRT
jgi:transporter family-2 protein